MDLAGVWCHRPVIPVLAYNPIIQELRHKDYEFKVTLNYTARPRLKAKHKVKGNALSVVLWHRPLILVPGGRNRSLSFRPSRTTQ